MRICIFTDSFLPYCSGVTYAVINQAAEMVRYEGRPPTRVGGFDFKGDPGAEYIETEDG